MTNAELEVSVVRLCRLLSKNRAEVALVLGCSERTLRSYIAGERAIPEALAARVRELLTHAA